MDLEQVIASAAHDIKFIGSQAQDVEVARLAHQHCTGEMKALCDKNGISAYFSKVFAGIVGVDPKFVNDNIVRVYTFRQRIFCHGLRLPVAEVISRQKQPFGLPRLVQPNACFDPFPGHIAERAVFIDPRAKDYGKFPGRNCIGLIIDLIFILYLCPNSRRK